MTGNRTTELTSVEKLREGVLEFAPNIRRKVCMALDEIEREVAYRYMLLPVDADGVPWHIGDVTENKNIVNGITFDRHGAHFSSTRGDIDPSNHMHGGPRTIEDVLFDYEANALSLGEAAAELRGMMEADE